MLVICNSNVIVKFVQLHYFLSENVGGTKDVVPLQAKSWGRHVPLSPS